MTSETLLLIGRDARNANEVLETHAARLERRELVDDVAVATYDREPDRELRDRFESIAADTVYAVPMCTAHTHDTLDAVPAALSAIPGDVRYGEPLGRSPAVTEVVADRAAAEVDAAADGSLVLVAFGSGSQPYHRQTADYHAARLRERTAYGEVRTCYLLQNPAVECVRYATTNPRAVAVPLFLARTEATERRIPDELELDRGGIAYADPYGTHPRVTDAVEAEVRKQRALAPGDAPSTATFDVDLPASRRRVATDGEGGRR
ncbi:sirohydrochlorin chelatase [Halorubellus sp. JP-L1]|uniref:CbiX/SirB N-terminal domain-containing protein n=1 Tax=Halorubellus sp. JP-L1 TaxID=2715753 RepID=UPI00140AD9A7|nr:CbiX/SirB N-terminal domain-containing protein [Halorubellus sp. JP-L1]NHN41681.1 sirohydrochlorin chelatase [Halorubellus sp. JP-L1]